VDDEARMREEEDIRAATRRRMLRCMVALRFVRNSKIG
jgi:hypothetical protein